MANYPWGSPEELYNPPANLSYPQSGGMSSLFGSGFGTPGLNTFTSGMDDPFAMLGVGSSKLAPFQSMLSGAGINEIPAWMQTYASRNFEHDNLAKGIQDALKIDPSAWLGSNGKMKDAMHRVGISKFEGGKGYNLWGKEVPWDDQTKAAVQQQYLDRLMKENQGGFNPLGAEGLGLGIVAAPILGAASLPWMLGGSLGGLGGGLGVPTTAGELGALGGGWGGGLGGLETAGGGGFLGGLKGMFGGGGMGFLDDIGGILGGGWGNVLGGGLGALGTWLGGKEASQGYDKGIDALMKMYYQNREDMKPLTDLLNYTGDFTDLVTGKAPIDYRADPIFKADRKEMKRTLNRGQASVGKLRSSDTDNAIVRNMSTLQNQAYGRKYGGMLDLLKLGSGAAGSAGAWGQNTGNALAGLYGAQGNAGANTIGGMFGTGMGALNNWQLMNMLQNMRRQ